MQLKNLGKYVIIEKIGQGAMGEVFKARDPSLNRLVAVKTLARDLSSEPDMRRRFKREAQSAANLNHPNIITVYDFGEEQGVAFIAMELLQGADLRALLHVGRELDLEQKLDLMEQICEGVGYAHAHGVVHRDLKPGNVQILPNGQVKILDFGLARLASSDMTKSGLVLGTPNYMSPEQVQGHRVDARSDVFSLGAVFYELLARRKPFQAESIHATMFKVAQGDRDPLTKWAPDLPESVVDVIERALAQEAQARFQSAGELKEALRAVRAELGHGSGSGNRRRIELNEELEPTRVATQAGIGAAVPGPVAPAPGLVEESSGKGTIRRRASRGKPTATSQGARWLVAALVVVAAGGAAYLVFFRPAGSTVEGGRPAESNVQELTAALVASRLELAQRTLDAKDYETALVEAERILEEFPDNAEAQRIRDEARRVIDGLEARIQQARTALEAGKTEDAARLLAQVMAVDASLPAVVDLAGELNQQFGDRAREARETVQSARRAASAAGARAVPEAERLAREGETLFERGEFASATQRFLSAQDRFEAARRAAVAAEEGRQRDEQAALRAELDQASRLWQDAFARADSEDVRQQPSYGTALSTRSRAEQLRDRGDLSQAARAYRDAVEYLNAAREEASQQRQRQAQAREAVNTPLPREPAAAPPSPSPPSSTAPPPSPSSSTSSLPAEVADEQAIRQTVAAWERAIETQDIALYRRAKPNLTPEEERRLAESFAQVDSHAIEIAISEIAIRGHQATVQLSRQDTLTANGNRIESPERRQTLMLTKDANGWVITELR